MRNSMKKLMSFVAAAALAGIVQPASAASTTAAGIAALPVLGPVLSGVIGVLPLPGLANAGSLPGLGSQISFGPLIPNGAVLVSSFTNVGNIPVIGTVLSGLSHFSGGNLADVSALPVLGPLISGLNIANLADFSTLPIVNNLNLVGTLSFLGSFNPN